MHPRCIGAVRCGSSVAATGAHHASPLHAAAASAAPCPPPALLRTPTGLRGAVPSAAFLAPHHSWCRQRRFCSGGVGGVEGEETEAAASSPTKQKRRGVRVAKKVRRRRVASAAAATAPSPPQEEEEPLADWEAEQEEAETAFPASVFQEAVEGELRAAERRVEEAGGAEDGYKHKAEEEEAEAEYGEASEIDVLEARRPELVPEAELRRIAPHKLLMPTLAGDVRPARTTRLSLNNLDFVQRERLTHVLQLSGVVPGGPEDVPPWKDFTLINHLSTGQWCLEQDRFNYLGKSVLERVLTEAFLQHCMENRLPWVQHMEPVTFEVSKASSTLRAPALGGSHGTPHFFSQADAHEPEVSSTLSSEHARQVEAIFLNVGSLTSLATHVGLHGLMNSHLLKTLASYTPAEKRNPTLIMEPPQIHKSDPSLAKTNLRALSNDKVGEKLLALVGSVRTQQGSRVAKKLARHLLFGGHVAEDARRGAEGGRMDVLELAASYLDDQVLRTSPSKVLAGLHQHMGIEVEWKTEVVEVRESEEEAAHLRAGIEEQDRVADSTIATLQAVKEKSEGLKEAQLALAEVRGKKSEAAIPEHAEDEANIAHMEQLEAERPMVLEDEDEYTLQFDAEGKPIDIRKTSLTYPQLPGPHQAETPISEAPMYSVPKPDAPLVERLYWKNMLKRQRDNHKTQLEAMFADLMRPKKLLHKTVMRNAETKQILGYGASKCAATARVDAQVDALKKIRMNLLSLRRATQDVEARSA